MSVHLHVRLARKPRSPVPSGQVQVGIGSCACIVRQVEKTSGRCHLEFGTILFSDGNEVRLLGLG